jgi:hypothetical protein
MSFKLSVAEMTLDEMSVDEMSTDEMTLRHCNKKMPNFENPFRSIPSLLKIATKKLFSYS